MKYFNSFLLVLFLCININIKADEGKKYFEAIKVVSEASDYPTVQTLGKFVPLSGNVDQMKHFFEALMNLKNKAVRIAHYGDSLLLGDIITQDIREKFQQKYGGTGAGFLNIYSDDNTMRATTLHTFSQDWQYISFLTRNPNQAPVGISGALAIPKIGSWVKYIANTVKKSSSSFNIVKVYYSNADESSTIQYSIDNAAAIKQTLEKGSGVKELVIKAPKTFSKQFYMQFVAGKSPLFYGVSLESEGSGVYVDNFPMRGNSGTSLGDTPDYLLQDFNTDLHYDLIILSYGTNVSSPNGNFIPYENKMVNVIKKYQKAFPNTSFLIVSTSDRTRKVGSRFETNPDVFALLEAQKRIAEKTGITFWNLSEMMGGKDSMDDWVDAKPALALKDYAHFTQLGGARVAELLFEAIMDAYSKIKK